MKFIEQIIAGAIFILAFGSAAVFAQTDKIFCSELKFAETQRMLNVNEPLRINVEVSEEFKKYKIKYLWAASGGEITSGQGTSAIVLTPREKDGGNNIFVTVGLDGLPEKCFDTNTHNFAVTRRIIDLWFEKFGRLSKIDLYGRLDNFFVSIVNDSEAEGFIALEFDKTETRAKKIKRLNEILSHVKRRKFDKSRLNFLISEASEEHTRLFIIPKGKKISDLIDEPEGSNLIKGEEIERKINEVFPPKKK